MLNITIVSVSLGLDCLLRKQIDAVLNIINGFNVITEIYLSFIPYAINLWNKLGMEKRSCNTVSIFKTELHKLQPEPNVLFYYGEHWPAMHHARIRMGCSALNYDLCMKMHAIGNSSCRCGVANETGQHFFLECNLFISIRVRLLYKDISN